MSAAGAARRSGALLLLAVGAAGIATLAGASASAGTKATGVVVIIFAVLIAATVLRDLTAVLLACLVLGISYNRQFYSFDAIFGDYGPAGLYWTVADGATLALLAAILLSAAVGRVPGRVPIRGLSIEPAMALMICAIALSATQMGRAFPGVVETARITKYLATFLLIRSVLNGERCWAILAGLALLVLLQTALGVVQVAMGAGGSGLSDIAEQTGEMAHRATGTLGHPNMLAPFLLTFVPGFAAIAMARYPPPMRLAAGVVAVVGSLAIVLSQSRAPILGVAVAVAATAAALAVRGLVPAKRVLGGGILLAFLATLAALPVYDRIETRLAGDFDESIAFRMGYNEAALKIWQTAPIFGVGPGGFVPALALVDPDDAATNEAIQEFRLTVNIKTIAPVHNVYLWLLAEIGLVGLGAFLVFVASLARLFYVAGASSSQPLAVFFVGVFWGFLAVVGEELTDFTVWWDHHMALLMVLAAMAAVQRDSQRAA
ncbi:MAG: O-antigen ligase family protein [Amaricoccus sp.]